MSEVKRKIGFITAMVISVGSTIGAGIFFKNSTIYANSNGSLPFVIVSWIISGLGVLGIGLALIELSTAVKSNAGIGEFTAKFTKRGFAKFTSAYMIFVSLPVNYIALPLYATMALQDTIISSGNTFKFSGWETLIIAFGFTTWLISMGFFQRKLAIESQWVFTIVKFIPLVIAPFFSMISAGQNGVQVNLDKHTVGLTSVSSWLGLMASVPAILFAFDGFYTITSVRSDLKDEKRMGPIVAVSLAVITAAYLFWGVITGIGGAGDIGEISNIPKWLMTTFNLFIMFAVLGIVNGFGIASPQVYEDTYKENAFALIPLVKKIFKVNDTKLAAFIVSALFGLLMYLILGPIGIYGVKGGSYEEAYRGGASLYMLADYTTNYTSLAVFVFIGATIFGGLINRKTQKIKVVKKRGFILSAIIAVVFLSIATIYMLVASIVDMTGYRGADSQTQIIDFCIMIFTIIVSALPNIYEVLKKQFNWKTIFVIK